MSGRRSREQVLKDEISCACTQTDALQQDCSAIYPIPPEATNKELEGWADYFSYMGTQTSKNQCMLKKGYAPAVEKKWTCHWHHV